MPSSVAHVLGSLHASSYRLHSRQILKSSLNLAIPLLFPSARSPGTRALSVRQHSSRHEEILRKGLILYYVKSLVQGRVLESPRSLPDKLVSSASIISIQLLSYSIRGRWAEIEKPKDTTTWLQYFTPSQIKFSSPAFNLDLHNLCTNPCLHFSLLSSPSTPP